MPKQKEYIVIDLKSFYASVECVKRGLDPLTTNLVVADSSKTEKTICLAVTPSLKSYGIPGRARLFEVVQSVRNINANRKAKIKNADFEGSSINSFELNNNPKLSLDYIAAPPRMGLYRDISGQIVSIYLKYVSFDDLYPYSIDEVFIDATPYLKKYNMTSQQFARMLIKEVYMETGITATAGIGENMYLCKVALDITAKHIPPDEDGVRVATLTNYDYRRTLWTHKPLTDFWMIGKGTERRLNKLGLFTMGDVALCSVQGDEILYKEFGKNAEYIIDQAWGYEEVTIADVKSYSPDSSSTNSGQVLPRGYNYLETRDVIRSMVENISNSMTASGTVTDQLVLYIGFDIDSTKGYNGEIEIDRYGRKVPKHLRTTINFNAHTCIAKEMVSGVLEAYDRLYDRTLLTRRIYISSNHILSKDEYENNKAPEQLDLFSASGEKSDKELNKQKAVVKIKERFGSNAILKGSDFTDTSTTRERNNTIGGHKA